MAFFEGYTFGSIGAAVKTLGRLSFEQDCKKMFLQVISATHLRVHEHGNRVAFVFHLCASRRSLQLTFDVLVFVGLGGFCCFLADELIFDVFLTF